MIHADFDEYSTLQYRYRAVRRELEAFRSGEKYRNMREEYRELQRFHNREIKQMKQELYEAHRAAVRIRKQWEEVTEDLEKEHRKEILQLKSEIGRLETYIRTLIRQHDATAEKLKKRTQEYYAVATELEEEREKNRKLTAQVNRDFENSAIPSSLQKPGRKQIPNSRVKTGRKPGGQPGHPGHRRKKHIPAEIREIPAPAEYTDSPDFYETGKIIRKQRISLSLHVTVTEYRTKEYRNRKTGARVHAPFPEGYTDDVNYDGSVKALAFLLSNECSVSHGKIRTLLSELTEGEVELSDGMINGLCREFSAKSVSEKKEIIRRLMTSPVMNADFTNASVNGKNAQVLVLASPSAGVALYLGRERKGHAGIEGTPLENYAGTVVHDHDTTFYSYGTGHQECTQHDIRYLTGSMQNEPELTWNGRMLTLFRQMLHYRNGLEPDTDTDPGTVAGFEAEYDRILLKAEEEYTDSPPGKYYREGYNLFLRLRKYKENELLFLHDRRVPANNSLCERLARVYKRKQKQAVTLRSQENLCCICDGLSVVHLLRSEGGNVYREISDIYNRRRPPRKKEQLTGTTA